MYNAHLGSTGLFVDPGKNGNANDVDLVKNLVSDYIRNPACIILLTVSCESKLALPYRVCSSLKPSL